MFKDRLEIAKLKDRVRKLEAAQPQLGYLDESLSGSFSMDVYKTVSFTSVIDAILDHLDLEIGKTRAIPESIIVTKRKKSSKKE